jgi:pimeloyl-ACP methyl ester carboxylesterase
MAASRGPILPRARLRVKRPAECVDNTVSIVVERGMTTYVLVHGAYQGGWIWKPVVERLRGAGHLVYAPTLDGCAERQDQVRPGITVGTHAREIARLLFYEDLRDVVLVGTSSGGMVICRAAELAGERLARLVFVDALALMTGERVADIVSRPAGDVTDVTIAPTRADAEGRMFADLEPATRAWALARYTPHPIAALEAPMELTTFWDRAWTASVIRCRRARNPPETHQRRTAERLKAQYAELDTGHYPMLSQPDELVRLLG